MDEQITTDNVFEVDVLKLALNGRFGDLVFKKAGDQLLKIQKALLEAHDLGFSEILSISDADIIRSRTKTLAEHLEWLRMFNIAKSSNASQEHTNFNARIDGFYNDVYNHILIRLLPFLRDQRRRENPSQKQLDDEIKKFTQVRSEMEKELEVVRKETDKIRSVSKDVGIAKGQRATARLASHFDKEVVGYSEKALYWFWVLVLGYVVVLCILIWLGNTVFSYTSQLSSLSVSSKGEDVSLIPNVVWGAIVSKLVILAAFWYGLSFMIKNYNVNSHLAAVNRHRAAVARTLEDFIEVEQQQNNPRLSEMLQNATDAMFKNAPIGYVTKSEKESGNPIFQIINDLTGAKNTG